MIKKPKILVVGDLMVDHYLYGECSRISPEAPVQVVDIQREESLLGGAGNVINNLLSLGCDVGVCSVVGMDESGEFIKKRLDERGVQSELLVKESGRKTSKKSRIIAKRQQIVRVDREDSIDILESSQEKIIAKIKELIDSYDLILLSDYKKGVLSNNLTKEIIKVAKSRSIKVLVDPKGDDFSKYRGAYLITPNKKEASIATNIEIVDEESLKEAGWKLKDDLDLNYAIITLSEDGIAIFGEKFSKIPTFAKEVFDVTGAGDTVLAAIGYELALNRDINEAVRFANLAAGVVVAKVGAATATCSEIYEYERSLNRAKSKSKIKSLDELIDSLDRSKKIVFTNGCFDILHVGHVNYLEEAKSFGDILIVGLNSDASVKRLKGESRPVNSQEDRAVVLSALESVDMVVIFDEDTPYDLIKRIEPDILVKGGDYKGKEVVGSDIAKETRLVEFVEGKSTTRIIERVRD